MKRACAAIILLMVLFSISAYAQQPILTAKIPFEFNIGSKTLPAGNYEFKVTQNGTDLMVRNLDTGKTVATAVVTRLAAESAAGTVKVTFDTIGEKKFLEAIWPDGQDGYLVHVTKEKHTHATVKAG